MIEKLLHARQFVDRFLDRLRPFFVLHGLDVECVPVALNSGVHWTGFLKRPGTIVLEFLEPIPAGLKRAAFMTLLEERIETATNRLLAP